MTIIYSPPRLRAILLMFVFVACTAALIPSAAVWQAPLRLAIAVCVGVLLPGWLLVRVLGWFPGVESYREGMPIAFGIGYVLIGCLCIIAVVLQLSILQAIAILAAVTIVLAVIAVRTSSAHNFLPSARPAWWFATTILLVVSCAWVLEPPIQGEETAELITIRKMVDGPTITLDGVMPEPKVIPTYVVTPYYFFVALMTKLSGISMFVAYLKLRALYAGIAMLSFSALAGRLFPSLGRPFADLVIPAFGVLFVLDPDPWSWPASMFPLVRRGSVSAGVIAPVFMLAALLYVSRPASFRKPFAEWLAPAGLMFALLTTHATEMLYAGFFFTGILVAGIVTPIEAKWNRLLSFAAACGVTAVGYKVVHERLASHVYAFDQAAKANSLPVLRHELDLGITSFGGISEAGRYLIVASGTVLPYVIVGILIVPWLMRAAAQPGTVLWVAILAPLAIYCSSKMFILLQLVTSTEIQFVFGYFSVLGVLAFLAGAYISGHWLASLVERRLPVSGAAVIVVVCAAAVAAIVFPAISWATSLIFRVPLILPWVLGLGGVVALMPLRSRNRGVGVVHSRAGGFACLAFVLVIGIGYRGSGNIDGFARLPLNKQLIGAMANPSVVDWGDYYAVLQRAAAPSIDLPRRVVDDLTRILPPRQVLISDPAHSYSLPVMLNQYIVNPGHVISTSLRYFDAYAPLGPDGIRHHPIFNDSEGLSELERKFLDEYGVQFIVANPRYQDSVGRKFAFYPNTFQQIYAADGFVVYHYAPNARE